MDTNRAHWDEVTPIHVASAFYDVAAFRAGRSSLHAVELAEVGEVRGKSLLHLQCHFGMDTLSWARAGADVTGVDYAQPAIEQARRLADELGVPARFVTCNVYDTPDAVDGQFDIVFTSYGVLCWLPDLPRWARIAAHFVKPGGTFYIAEFHPFASVFDDAPGVTDLRVHYPYFSGDEPQVFDNVGTYTDGSVTLTGRIYEFQRPVSDVVTALIDAGLRIEHLHEFPFSTHHFLAFTQEMPDGTVRLKKHDGCVPLLYSVKATKPG